MKITFILPAIGKKQGQRYIRTWQQMEPLTFSTLKAMTPDDVEVEVFDDRVEMIDFDTRTDLVAITAEIYTARRAFDIAGRFRAKGIPVLMGGYHTTICPDEVAEHADAILIGNAESVWGEIIEDFRRGEYKARYHGDPSFTDILPDRSVFGGKKYSRVGVIESSRGCLFDCEFCAITAFHKGKFYKKPLDTLVRDFEAAKAAGKQVFFITDDNFVADQEHAIEVLKELARLKVRWTGQGSLTMARNPELLKRLRESGCTVMLIGYESLESKNLEQMNKSWTSRLGEIDDLTGTLHDGGLNIYATFVFGFDHDTPEIFGRTVDFALKHKFFFTAFNHLAPMPGTRLYKRLLDEGKILEDKWWLNHGARYGEVTFRPECMTAEALSEMCRQARKRFYTFPSILKRSFAAKKRNPDWLLYYYYWHLNLKMQQEVDEKMGLPLGEGLDELPK